MRQKNLGALMVTALVFLCSAAPVRALGPGDTLTGVGKVVAIELETDGVIVAGFATVDTEGGSISPAADSALRPGDRIVSINGMEIHDEASLLSALEQSRGSVELAYERGGHENSLRLDPVVGRDGKNYLGLWLRSGISGIGTVTYQDPQTGAYGALGHGVGDESGKGLTPILGGEIGSAAVESVVPGQSGATGELIGVPVGDSVGQVERNTPLGIFGTAENMGGEAYSVAAESEIALGSAEILCTVAGEEPDHYAVEITRIDSGSPERSLTLRVTDTALLEKTGGIVQGMSGSPIIQNGKMVGAVTHVLVEDPAKGYGISMEKMLDAAG